jgi:hypothetical protein
VLDKYFNFFDASQRLTGKVVRYVKEKNGVFIGTSMKVGINSLRDIPGACAREINLIYDFLIR